MQRIKYRGVVFSLRWIAVRQAFSLTFDRGDGTTSRREGVMSQLLVRQAQDEVDRIINEAEREVRTEPWRFHPPPQSDPERPAEIARRIAACDAERRLSGETCRDRIGPVRRKEAVRA